MKISDFIYEQRGNLYIIGLLLFALILVQPVLAFTGSGAGTGGDPYQITSAAQWAEMDNSLAASYKLMNNIDFGGASSGRIGTYAAPFTGTLDGNGKSISNLIIPYDYSGTTYVITGIIICGSGANIHNLAIKNADIDVATHYNSVYMTVIGGLSSSGSYTMEHVFIDDHSSIKYSDTSGVVQAGSFGGVNGKCTVHECGSLASIYNYVGSGTVGGLIGAGADITTEVDDSYFGGNILFPNGVGTAKIGGLVGQSDTTRGFTAAYYDSTKNTPNNAEAVNGTAKTTSEMKNAATYTLWTVDSTHWKMSGSMSSFSGYPVWYTTPDEVVPVADFTVDNTQVDVSLPVAFVGTPFHFTDLSTNTPTSWNWSYGDGNYGTSKNATHAYSTVGTYDVSLTATNGAGSDVETKSGYINVVPAITGMTFTPSAPVALSTGATQAFAGSYSGSKFAQLWDFGDGYTSDVSPLSVSHQYNTAGTYTVSYGLRDGQNTWNYVNKTALMVISGVVTPNFTFTPSTGTAPLSVTFSDTSSGGTFLSASWNFGDGSTTSTRNPTHTFTSAGTKSVSLLWENTAHDTGYIVKTIVITSATPPVANFTGTPLTGNAPQTVTFTDLSTNTPTSWMWSFGDGSTATTQNPTHTYTAGGNYTVVLTATNPGGSGSVSKNSYLHFTNPYSDGGIIPNVSVPLYGVAPAITLDYGTKTTLNAWPVGVNTILGEHVLVGTNTTGISAVTVGGHTYNVDSWELAYYRQIPMAPATYSPPAVYSVLANGVDTGNFLVDTPETCYDMTTAEYGNATYMFRLFAINASYTPTGGEYDYGISHILATQENMTVGYLPPVASWSGSWAGTTPKVGETIVFNYHLESLKGLSGQTDRYTYMEYSEDGGTTWHGVAGFPNSITADGTQAFTASKAEILRGYVFAENLVSAVSSPAAVLTIGDINADPTFVWKNSGGTTITSATDTQTVYFGLNTGTSSWQNKPAWSELYLYFQKYNPNTGLWDTLDVATSGYTESAVPGYTMNLATNNHHIWGKRTIAGYGSFIPMGWKDSNYVTVPEGKYRAVMMANGATGTMIKMAPELTVTKNMVNPSNVAGAAGGLLGLSATGGDAGIFFGFILMVIFALAIFYVARYNVYGLLGGAAIGFLISWALGLFPVWMVYILMVICIGLIAVVFLLGRGGGGESSAEG